jgi:hypothetical protein
MNEVYRPEGVSQPVDITHAVRSLEDNREVLVKGSALWVERAVR